ncbi:hypothetical protein C3492_43100 [Streptomyces sp. Ru62]|nr:hypothetical protein C3492_43100 [Streptomyces sp. Ru62]
MVPAKVEGVRSKARRLVLQLQIVILLVECQVPCRTDPRLDWSGPMRLLSQLDWSVEGLMALSVP